MRHDRIDQRAVEALARAREVARQERATADAVLHEAQRLVTVVTGRARRSLVVVEVRNPNGHTEYRIGWDLSIAEHGPILEFGSEDTAPQPHLRPAALKVRGR